MEDADARIRFAIAHRRMIRFRYRAAWRVAEPHDYGTSGGRHRLFVFQTGGTSHGSLSGWRLMDVADILDLQVLDETFAGSRDRPGQTHKRWDDVFCRVR